MRTSILCVLAILLPSLPSAAERIDIDFKILESAGHEIPHDLAKAEKIEGIEILTLPSVSTESDQIIESVIFRELLPEGVIKQGFTSARIGTQLTVTPSLFDGKIAFTATITISKLVDKKGEGGRFQTEIQSRVVYLSANQNSGEAGWFDLAEPGLGKDKKTTVWIRLTEVAVAAGGDGVISGNFHPVPGYGGTALKVTATNR